jgi:hypothetical protein
VTIPLAEGTVVVALIVVVPGPVAVTSPDAETVATVGDAVCHESPDVTTAPALVVAVSWLVCPRPDRKLLPPTVRMATVAGGFEDVGVVGDPQPETPETNDAATEPITAHHDQGRGRLVPSRRSPMRVMARFGSIALAPRGAQPWL